MTELWLPPGATPVIEAPDRPAWDRPPTLTYQEVANARQIGDDDGRRPLAALLEGRYTEIDTGRYLRGEICVKCAHTLPENPSAPGALRRIMDTPGFDLDSRYEPYPGRRVARQRISTGRCPVCDTEMSPEMAAAMFAGTWDERDGSEAWRDWAKGA